MNIRVQVSCLAIRDGALAMIRKIRKDDVMYNKLIPPGGHVEPRETLEQACAREMCEETGLIVTQLELKGVVSFISHTEDFYHSVCFFYVARQVDGEFATDNPDESEKLEPYWIPLAEIDTHPLVPDYHRDFIRHLTESNTFLNARVEWYAPEEKLTWTIEQQQVGVW